jgi:hypothetical protein
MDVLHDNSMKTWIHIGETYSHLVPSYVMNYNLPDKEGSSKIEDGLFADPARRLFPIDDPGAIWLSAAYFAKNASALPYKPAEREYVKQTILKAAALHDIATDVKTIIDTITATPAEKQAEDDDANYGWVMRNAETGDVVARKYPMFDGIGVKKASDYFAENRAHYPIGVRRTISRNIMRKAAEYGMGTDDLAPAVLREAGYGIPRKDILMDEILERAHLTKDAESSILLANVNELLAGMDATEIGANLDKIAEVIDTFDNAAGLTQYYNKRILMPADFLYDINLKQANEAVEDAIELDRHVFSLRKLAELPLHVFEDVLGADFVKAIVKKASDTVVDRAKLADELYSLPKPDKSALERHLTTLYR